MRSLMTCDRCGLPAVEWIRYSGEHLCRDHFLAFVERRAKRELRSQVDLQHGERIAIGMSGGEGSGATAALLRALLPSPAAIKQIPLSNPLAVASLRPPRTARPTRPLGGP